MNRKAITENPVTVEFDSRGRRERRTFPNSLVARRFYARKFRDGRNPQVVARQSAG